MTNLLKLDKFYKHDNPFSRSEKVKGMVLRERDVRGLSYFQNFTKNDKIAVNGSCIPKKGTLKEMIFLSLCINLIIIF